jgi:membrane associated rhomboid family serine protease
MVFPLYDDDPFKLPRLPWATWTLIGINAVVFLWSDGSISPDALLAKYGAVPGQIAHPFANGWRPEFGLVTSMFLHAGWAHILGNMVYLWVFGDDIEEALGPWRFLLFYFAAGIAAALAFVAVNPSSTVPLVGASGAIAGVLAAYVMLRPCAKVTVFVLRVFIRVRAVWVIAGWGVLQIVSMGLAGQDDDVAYMAHVGGFAAGALLFYALRPAGVRLFECVGEGPAVERATLF